MRKLKFVLAGLPLVAALVLGVFPAVANAAPVLPNGLTAKVIATSNQKITGTIDAAGYDVGIYIGPGVHNVKVDGATVTGANDQGILVQDASGALIENSTISGNGIAIYPGVSESKGIVLAGARNCLVKNNTIQGNGDGGISVLDDGPSFVFAPIPIDTAGVAATGNVITGNLVKDNLGGCGIVVSAKNSGGGVSHNVVSGNTVLGFDPTSGDFAPGVGGIIVATGAFAAGDMTDNVILNNVVTGGFIPGISFHVSGGVVAGTKVIGNKLSDNGSGAVSGSTTGIEMAAAPGGTISGTQVLANTVSNDYFGIWHVGDTGTHIANLTTNGVTVPVGP